QLGGHGRHVGAPAHAVGSKELTLIHESGLRWLARSEPAGCAARGATSGAGLEGGSCGRASTGQSRKLTNCRSRSSFSAPRSIWITSWRSSRFLPETRTESSWMAAWTLSLASLISLTISLAFSVSMPSFTRTSSLKELRGPFSGSPASRCFKLTLRRISFVWSTSRMAFVRSSVLARSTISLSLSSISAPVPLKSKRWPTSCSAWLTAFFTSDQSTLETTSNEGIVEFLLPGERRARAPRVGHSQVDGGVHREPQQVSSGRPHEERRPGDHDEAARPHELPGPLQGAGHVGGDLAREDGRQLGGIHRPADGGRHIDPVACHGLEALQHRPVVLAPDRPEDEGDFPP